MGDLLYGIAVLVILFFGISLMANGWGLMSMSEREHREEHEYYKDPKLKKMVEESTHPEMQDIESGEELMVVNFVEEAPPIDEDRFKLDSPELHNLGDPLHKSLKDRIDMLREEVKDEDDEDDGGSAVVARR